MRTFEIEGVVVFADSAIQAIRQAIEDADEISYLTADPDGRYSQYCVDDELVTVFVSDELQCGSAARVFNLKD